MKQKTHAIIALMSVILYFIFIIDIYILQCTKLKIGCLICKYRFFL